MIDRNRARTLVGVLHSSWRVENNFARSNFKHFGEKWVSSAFANNPIRNLTDLPGLNQRMQQLDRVGPQWCNQKVSFCGIICRYGDIQRMLETLFGNQCQSSSARSNGPGPTKWKTFGVPLCDASPDAFIAFSAALQNLARNPRWQYVAEWMRPQVVESEPVILDPGSLIHILVFYSTTHCSSLLRNIGQRASVCSPVTGHFSPGRQVLERRISRSRRQNFNTYVHTTI